MSSQASKRAIKEMGNIELYDLGETVRTTQCPACLRHSKEGTVYCVCGKCLMPSPDQTESIKYRIDIISDPLYVVQQGVRGVRHGPGEWQYHHWKAQDATKNVRKRDYTTIAKRWQYDPSHLHGWTLEYCIFLDWLNTVDIESQAPREERIRYHNQYVLRWKDEKNPGKIPSHDYIKKATRSLATVSTPGRTGRCLFSTEKQNPTGSRSTSSCLRNSDGLQNRQQIYGSQASSSSSTTWWENHNNGRNDANGKNDKIGTDGRTGTREYRHLDPPSHCANFCASQSIFLLISRRDTAKVVHVTGE